MKKITPEELSLVKDNMLCKEQLSFLMRKTPSSYVKKRPAKGGGTWSYVPVEYVVKVLNLMFGWNWDFDVVKEDVYEEWKEVVVKGRLTCRGNGGSFSKTNFGNKDIVFKRGTQIPLSIGNDLKSAASDALKKCASMIGIASDVYCSGHFSERIVEDITLEELVENHEAHKSKISDDLNTAIRRIIDSKEKESYNKAFLEIKKNT